MPLHIDPQAWIAGVKDAYAGVMPRSFVKSVDGHAYASGRVEGEALRLRHRREYEQLLFSGRQTREIRPPSSSND